MTPGCRVYLLCEKLKVPGAPRPFPAAKRALMRVMRRLLPSQPVWVQVRSGFDAGLWMRLKLRSESKLWLGRHEPLLQKCLIELIQPGAVVYDIGAHLGSIALGLARAIRSSGGQVVAFEADPENADALRESADRNGLVECLQVVSSAAWSSSSLNLSFRKGGGKRSHGGVEAGGFRPVRGNGDLITIPAITLDDFVAHGGPVPHLVKIDVEGGEFEVLRGSEQLFAKHQPLLVAEIHLESAEREIRSWLEKLIYSSHWIVPPEQYPSCVFAWPAGSPHAQDWSRKLTELR